MHLTLNLADIQPLIEQAVKGSLDLHWSEIKSLLATAGSSRLRTVPEAAEFLQVCERTVRNFAERGELIATRIGGNVRFAQSDLENFVNANKTTAQPAATT